MSELLSERLKQCKIELSNIQGMLDGNPDALIDKMRSWIAEIFSASNEIDQSIELIRMREEIFSGIERIDSADFLDETVSFSGVKLPFPTARLMMVQSYLVTNWSISDKISRIACKILLKEDATRNRAQGFDFISLFFERGEKKRIWTMSIYQKRFGIILDGR